MEADPSAQPSATLVRDFCDRLRGGSQTDGHSSADHDAGRADGRLAGLSDHGSLFDPGNSADHGLDLYHDHGPVHDGRTAVQV